MLCLLATGACVGIDRSIEGDDHGVVFPALRLRHEIGSSDADAVTAELEVSGHAGEFAPENPAFSRVEYRAVEVHLGVHPGLRFDDFTVAAILGLDYVDFDIDVPGDPLSSSNSDRIGPRLGASVAWRAAEWLELYARASATPYLFGASGTRLGAGALLRPTAGLGVFAGYQRSRFREESLHLFGSERDVDITADGVMVGVQLDF